MDISERGLAMIKDYESYSGEAYLCPEGVPTIGWGSIRWSASRPVKLGDTCTVAQAEQLLRKEVQRIDDALDTYIVEPLSQGEWDCLGSWAYNVGIGWINGKREGGAATLIGYINSGHKEKVPSELLRFKKGAVSKKTYGGLLNRRKREIAELWLAGGDIPEPVSVAAVADEDKSPMPQAVGLDRPTAAQAVAQSSSAKAAIVGIGVTTYQAISSGYQWLFSVAQEAGPEVLALKTTLSPLDALIKLTPAMMALAVAGILGFIIFRKIAVR